MPHRPQAAGFSRWKVPDGDAAAAAVLASAAGVPPVIAELLVQRGVSTAAEAEEFLAPQLIHLLDPYAMLGMREAVGRIHLALERREPILIYGDYDVDGTTAVVLLKTAIEMLGGVVRFHVPHRIREGYGMQAEVLEAAYRDGVRLAISVDNGIRAFAAAAAAASLGLDLIITDHHLPEQELASGHDGSFACRIPPALAVLNPNQPGCGYGCKHLCGAGVAFKIAQALLEGHDPQRARSKILPSFLKILAIAIVADAVPLLGENRTLAGIGLRELRNPVHAGLRHLMKLADLETGGRPPTTTEIAFRLAPRINAAGRMDVAGDVIDLFTTRDAGRARELAEKLDRLNSERKAAEAEMLREIEQRLESDPQLRESLCAVIDGDGWSRGIIGILASRVVDRTGRPAIVIARENGEAHGSGRSIPGFHLLNAIESCGDLFTRYGGHAHAVGFCLPSDRIAELRERLSAWAEDLGAIEARALACHLRLPLDQIDGALYSWLQRLEPFGMGNEEPVFVAENVRVVGAVRILKDRHVRLRLAQGRQTSFSALGWDWAAKVQALGVKEDTVLDLAYRLRQNEHPDFGGLELEIVDIAFPEA